MKFNENEMQHYVSANLDDDSILPITNTKPIKDRDSISSSLMLLSDNDLSIVLFNLSRSGRVIIPNYFMKLDVEGCIGDEVIGDDEMLYIQKAIESFEYQLRFDFKNLHEEYQIKKREDGINLLIDE